MRLFLVVAVALAAAGGVDAESSKNNAPIGKKAPRDVDPRSETPFPVADILKWKEAKGPIRKTILAGTGPDVTDPEALVARAVKTELGVQWAYERTVGDVTVRLERYKHPVLAFGAFSAARPTGSEPFRAGGKGFKTPDRIGVWFKDEYVELVIPPQAKTDAEKLASDVVGRLDAWHAALPPAAKVDPEEETPFVIRRFPVEGIRRESIRFAVGPAGRDRWKPSPAHFTEFPLPPGAQFAWAEFDAAPFGLVAMAEYPTPQDAQTALDSVGAAVRALPEGEKASRLVARQGNFVLEAFGVTDAARAEAMLKGVSYDYVVRWLGENPYAGRGFDPASETRKTATILTSTFQLVAIASGLFVIFGIAVGGGYFFWRRRQATAYTDAGGMMRLNLEDSFMLPPASEGTLQRVGHDE